MGSVKGVNETIKEIEEYSSTSKDGYSDDREDNVDEKPVNKIKFNRKEVKGKKINRDRKISSRNGKLERNYVYCC